MTQAERNELMTIIRELSYEEREVTLASGRKSNFYFDGKQTTLHPRGGLLVGKAFYEDVITSYSIHYTKLYDGFRPGVTDNVGRTAREAIQYLTGRPFAAGEAVYTSVQYLFKGRIDVPTAESYNFV